MRYRINRRVEGDIYLLDERQKVFFARVEGLYFRAEAGSFYKRVEGSLY